MGHALIEKIIGRHTDQPARPGGIVDVAIEDGLVGPGATFVSTNSHANIMGAVSAFGQVSWEGGSTTVTPASRVQLEIYQRGGLPAG